MTEQQKQLQRYMDRASVRVDVITSGIADVMRRRSMDSVYDLEMIQGIIDNDLEPAIKLYERTQADMDESYSKPRKTPPDRTLKTRSADPKPTKAKKGGK